MNYKINSPVMDKYSDNRGIILYITIGQGNKRLERYKSRFVSGVF